jgi:hypothetical protein
MADTSIPDNNTTMEAMASLKRRIAHLEEQNNSLRGTGPLYVESQIQWLILRHFTRRNRGDSYALAGRAIRRLVSLTDDIGTLVDEHDRRLLDSADVAQCTEE